MIHEYDEKVGKIGGAKPQQTISGNPIPRQVASTLHIGNGFYVVIDAHPVAGYQSVVDALRRKFNKPKSKPKREAKDEPEK